MRRPNRRRRPDRPPNRPRPRRSLASAFVARRGRLAVAVLSLPACGGGGTPAPPSNRPATAVHPLFTGRPIGLGPQGEERPMISHVAVADLDGDGLQDAVVCDAFRN